MFKYAMLITSFVAAAIIAGGACADWQRDAPVYNIRASLSDTTPSKPLAAAPVPQSQAGTTPTVVEPVAPNIPPIAIAKAIIGRDFDARDCPTVTLAERISDGTIAADCSNGERFRIFVFQGKTLAMRCSAVRDLVLKALCGVPIDAGIKEMGPSFIYGPRRTPRRPVTSRGGF